MVVEDADTTPKSVSNDPTTTTENIVEEANPSTYASQVKKGTPTQSTLHQVKVGETRRDQQARFN
eukprot:3707338-Ditylum_brightwellii.AAC.1